MSAETARAAREALQPHLDANLWDLPPAFTDLAERYVRLLVDANRRLNLTRVVEPDAVARLHLLDALAALPVIDEIAPDRAVDLGSGGGVPGLVLAMARPEVHWTLVDSVRKKAEALLGFATELRLANVTVVADRAEVLGRDPSRRDAHGLVTARACAALPVLIEYALPLLRAGGRLVAWKGPLAEMEVLAGTTASALLGGDRPEIVPSGVPVLGDHRFVVVRKERATPPRYPRRPGEPARRPLA